MTVGRDVLPPHGRGVSQGVRPRRHDTRNDGRENHGTRADSLTTRTEKTESETSEGEPRLAPIEEPDTWRMKLAYWLTERRTGKVITPLKVINARIPAILLLSYEMDRVERDGLSLDDVLKSLITSHVAALNGCAFCVDISRAEARERDVGVSKYEDLRRYETSSAFTERERAALAYVEEVTRTRDVSDETYERLEQHFDDREIAEITWLNARENYFNLLNRPLGIGSDGLCEQEG